MSIYWRTTTRRIKDKPKIKKTTLHKPVFINAHTRLAARSVPVPSHPCDGKTQHRIGPGVQEEMMFTKETHTRSRTFLLQHGHRIGHRTWLKQVENLEQLEKLGMMWLVGMMIAGRALG